jgi:hypothetical protein
MLQLGMVIVFPCTCSSFEYASLRHSLNLITDHFD